MTRNPRCSEIEGELSAEGHIFAGRFRAERRLHECLRIETWIGADLITGNRIVLKVCPASSLANEARERLEHEAVILRQMESPWVAPLLQCGREISFFYLVLPFVPGVTLEQYLAKGPLSVSDALLVGKGLIAGLRDVHDCSVLHRDIKPSNIIIGPQGFEQLTIIDFGLALSDRLSSSLQELPVGTVRYLSPEQAGLLSAPIGIASDLYSVGVVLFECLAGRPLFQGTVGEVLHQHLTVKPNFPETSEKMPRAFKEIIQHLLEKSPENRYQSTAAALADLEALETAMARGVTDPKLVIGLSDRRGTLTQPSFVGRQRDLHMLETTLEQAARGKGSLVLLDAESGAGKTRILEELAFRAINQGARVFRGQGVDQSVQHPFYVLMGVAQEIAAAKADSFFTEEFSRQMVPYRQSLCTALPPLTEILGHSTEETEVEADGGSEIIGKSRSVKAAVAMLKALGNERTPAVVLLDDCQWADELTLEAIATGFREMEDESASYTLIVAAFRTEEIPSEHPLRKTKAARHWKLEPLAVSDTRSLVTSMMGRIPEEAMQIVLRLSLGNPFMASAVVHGLVESGALKYENGEWQSKQEAMAEVRSSRKAAYILTRRLAILSEEARNILSIGAILGREFSLPVVAALAGCTPEHAMAVLQEPLRRHIIWIDAGGIQYYFVHDKLRETLLGMLSPEKRKTLHRSAALYLQGPDEPFEIAYHFDAAGDNQRAFPYALVAAERARGRYALATAERYYRMADRGATEASQAKRQAIAEGLGDVLMLQGRYEEAGPALQTSSDLSQSRLEKARTEGKLGELAFKQGNVKGASGRMEQALHLLGRQVPQSKFILLISTLWEVLVQVTHTFFGSLVRRKLTSPRAAEDRLAMHLFSQLMYAHWFQSGKVECLCYHLRGMNLAERYPPTLELAQAYAEHAPIMTLLPLFNRGLNYALKSFAIRKEHGDLLGQGQSLSFYGVVLYNASRFSENIDACRESIRLLERTGGDQWQLNISRSNLALGLYRAGRLPEALEVAHQLSKAGAEIGDLVASAVGLEVMAKATGGHVPADPIAQALARAQTSGDVQVQAELLQADAIRLMTEGDPGKAVQVLERADRLVRKAKLRQEYVAPVLPWLATALREESLQLGDFAPTRRTALLRRAEKAARRGERIARSFRNNLPHALRERGLIAALLGRTKQARKKLDESLFIAERQGMALEAAQTRYVRAQVGVDLGWNTKDEHVAAEQAFRQFFSSPVSENTPSQTVTPSLLDRFPRVLEAGRKIASALNKDTLFAAVKEAAAALLRGEECFLIEAGQDDLISSEAAGLSRSVLRQAFEGQQPVVFSEGLTQDATESMVLSGFRSILCAPLLVRGKSVACIYVIHRQLAGMFGTEEVKLSEFIATLAGAALENIQNFDLAQEALHKRDEFIAVASHELKTPLTPLLIHVQTMLNAAKAKTFDAAGEWAHKLETASGQVRRMGKLVDELLDLSRISQHRLTLNLGPTELTTLVQSVVEGFRAEFTRVGSFITARSIGPVEGYWDHGRLEQVFTNLLSNALKYGNGKPIEIVVDRDEASALISIRDEGIGISPEDQQRVFERFERAVSVRHYGGFGLGLWISREIVRAHGGDIHLVSQLGKGATFMVQLPFKSQPLDNKPPTFPEFGTEAAKA